MKKLLVIELWAMGDGVLMSALLRSLSKDAFEMTVLCKAATQQLLQPTYPEVRFVTINIPWTSFSGKYRLWSWPWQDIRTVIKLLRREHFDAAVSVRHDPRDHFLMWLVGARRRIGFGHRLSLWFLTESLPQVELRHRAEDWQALSATLGSIQPVPPCVTPVQNALPAALKDIGIYAVLHCGAGHVVRRWPWEYWQEVLERLEKNYGCAWVLLTDMDGYGKELAESTQIYLEHTSLKALQAVLAHAEFFMGNDSGPAHLAAALGTPAIALFGPQRPELFGPYGEDSLAISDNVCQALPCHDACRQQAPFCIARLSVDVVYERIAAHLDALISTNRIHVKRLDPVDTVQPPQ